MARLCAYCADYMSPKAVSEKLCDDCLSGVLWGCANGDEYWIGHPRYPGYEVSSWGQVKSPRKILKGTPKGEGGYLTVGVAGKQHRIHHLVLTFYISDRPEGMWALHWDDVKTNNKLTNLHWGSPAANRDDAVRNGRVPRRAPCSTEGCRKPARAPGATCHTTIENGDVR